MAAVMADLGANLVAMLVMLIAVASLSGQASMAERVIPAVITAPLSGQGQSDLLFLRLRPDPPVLVIELTEAGAFVPKAGRMVPMDEYGAWPERAVVFVFSARHYATLRAAADARGVTLLEVTVPDALRSDPAGESGFSQRFMDLRTGPDPASIRPELLRLLTSGPAAGGIDADGGSPLGRLLATAARLFNLALLLASLWLLRRLHRRLKVKPLPATARA